MISVVIATHNEEKNLEKCLLAVKDIADEIVIVDGESTDNTVKIAKRFSSKVIVTTNKSNFHINKQMAMDAAKGDLIFQLDADEVVDEELHRFIKKMHNWVLEIKKALKLSSTEKIHDPKSVNLPSAWQINRKNWFLGRFLKKGGQYPDSVTRLYLFGQAHLPQKDVHEQILTKGELAHADGNLLHYSSPTFSDYLRKWNTYTSFRAEQWLNEKLSISFSNTLKYLFFQPILTFFSIFIRHRGYLDGIPGFIFALMSGFYFSVAYLKLWESYKRII